MKLGRVGAFAASFMLAVAAHAVYQQSVAVTGQGTSDIAVATVSFTTESGETVDVRSEPSATVDGDIDLFLQLPDGTSSPPGKLTFTRKDGSARTFELPSAPAGERPRIDLRTGRVTLETTPTFATVASTTPQVTFVPPPPFSGPVVQWTPEAMSEEDRLAIQQRLELTNAQAEARASASIEDQVAQQQEVFRAAAPDRDAAEDKAIEYARAHKIEGLTDWMLVGSTGENGRYDSITFRMKAGVTEYEATFDGEGNVLTPFAETPSSKAMQNAIAHKPEGSGVMTAVSDKDVYGNTFVKKVTYSDGRGYLLFNERGIAYKGEFFDEDGKRTGAFSDPSELPQYGDPMGRLPPIDYQPFATTPCEPCQPLVDRYNALAAEVNQIAREMNDLAERHRSSHELSNRFEVYGQELQPLRARYEHLAPIWRDKAIELGKLRDDLIDCAEKECGGEPADDVGCTGMDCAANPFDEPIYLAGPNDVTVPAVWAPSDAFESSTCPYLSQPAETIACSVHTFERSNLCGSSPANEDWSLGECTANEDGGNDAEVFIRNPDDNNLRNGCGDIDRAMLIGNIGPVFENTKYVTIHVACNTYAQDAAAGPSGIIRGHRDQLQVDTSDRSKADHDREQRRKHTEMGPSNQHLVVRNLVNDATAAGVGQACAKKPAKEKEEEEDDPDFSEIGDNVKTVGEQIGQLASPDEGTTRLEALVGGLGAGNKVFEATGGKADKVSTLIKAAEAGMFAADKTVRTLSGEAVLSLDDAKTAVEHAAAISGNGPLETLGSGFGVLQKLAEIKLKQEQGIPIETSDVKELADALEEVRGDRFAGLGHVLNGISKSAEVIGKGEEVIEDLMKVWDILKPGGRPTDGVEIFDAFADYVEILAKLAGYVPGMGEFVSAYAEALKNMRASVQAIANATDQRNKAIAMVDEAIEGPNYQLLMQDAEQFKEDFGSASGGGEQLSADEINLNRATADQRAAVDDAEQDVKRYVDCVNGRLLDLYELQLEYEQLKNGFPKLPTEKEKQARIQQAAAASQYFSQMQASPGWLPDAQQAARMGASSARDAAQQLMAMKTQRKADEALDRARQQPTQESADKKAEEMKKEFERLMAELEECKKNLLLAYQQFWQATRDYAAAYSYFHTLATQKSTQVAEDNRKAALAEIDQLITKAGFSVSGTKVVVIVVSDCDEKKSAVMVGR